MDSFIMISLYISNLLSVLIFFSFGKITNSFLFPITKKEKITLKDVFFGAVYLSFLSILINFFLPLNNSTNNFILILSFIFLLIICKNSVQIRPLIKYTFVIGSISFLIMLLATSNRPDAGLYHLPYISILNENKLIIGLTNIHFRFGHTSIIQYTSAIFNNSIFLTKGITLPISTILVAAFLYFYENFLKNKKNYFLLVFYFLMTVFISLKVNRYDDIGNDAIGHLFFFITISLYIKYSLSEKIKYANFYNLSLFSIFAFTNKVFLIFSFMFPFFYIFFTKRYDFFF